MTRRGSSSQRSTGWLMTLPGVAGLVLFVALPFAIAVVYSATVYKLGAPQARFVGLHQYGRILTDPSFLHALRNNALFAGVVVPLQTALALGLALLLHRSLPGIAVYRSLFFLPVVFPMALVAVVWQLLYAPATELGTGLIPAFLETVTFGGWDPATDVFRDPTWALPAIILLSVWQGVGFQMVILLAGLQSIPETLYEAAAIDTAGTWARFRHVTLPQLRNPLIFVALVTTILSFRLFDQVQILTQGGPFDATTTVMYEAYDAAYVRGQVGRAAAMTVVFFLIVLAVVLIQRRVLREEREIA
jgi:multiple sugar transport system permease protein